MVRLVELHGGELAPHLEALGRLRISVFRDYPYLYDGSLDYEREYLQRYLNSDRSLVVLAVDGEEVVGATTCLPMADEDPEFKEPFVAAAYDIAKICYFGESILLPGYRAQGLGKAFFDRRESHALRHDFGLTTFCAVDRPHDHPLRPPDYRPLDAFWQSRGYTRQPDLRATFVWKELGEAVESPKTLTFWTRSWPTT